MFGGREVAYIFKARDQFTRTTDRMNRATTRFRKNMSGLNKWLTRAGTALVAFGAAAAAAAAGGLLAVVRVGQEFQDQMFALASLTGEAGASLDYFRERSMALGETWGISSSKIMMAQARIASLNSELLKQPPLLGDVTNEVMKLAIGTGIGLDTAVTTLVGSMNMMGVEATRAGEYANVLAAGEQKGAALLADVAMALENVGATAKTAGLNFVELNALIHVLAKGTIKGAKAGVGLRGVLMKLDTHVDKKFRPSLQGLMPVLELLETTIRTNADAEKMFGQEHGNTALTILGMLPTLRQFIRLMEGTDVATERADKMMELFSKRVAIVKTKVQNALIKTFLRLEPVLTKHVDAFSGWLDSITSAEIDNFVDSLTKMADALAIIAGLGRDAFNAMSFMQPALQYMGSPVQATTAGLGNIALDMAVEILLKGNTEAVDNVKTKTAGQGVNARTGVNMRGE